MNIELYERFHKGHDFVDRNGTQNTILDFTLVNDF